jgi:hypothetical protein
MSRVLHRKKIVAISAVCVLLAAGGAYAYWTAGGSGTGSAPVGTSAPLTAIQTTTLTAMYPGDTAQIISGNFNNTNAGLAYVGTVTASISSVAKAVGAPAGTCDSSDFTLANAAMTVNAEVPAGTAQGAWTGASLKFNDKTTTNQDACKGATVSLAYAIA